MSQENTDGLVEEQYPSAQPGAAAKSDAQAETASKVAMSQAEKHTRPTFDITRRALCIGAVGTAALAGLGALRYVGHNPLCRPPGGQDESHLVSACIRCQKCYEACPRDVIKPALIEDGFLGMRTPMLTFDSNYCDYCTEFNGGTPYCVEVCPTDALQLDAGATVDSVIIGLAVINTKECLAYRNTGCKSCYDACPYEAIELDSSAKNARPYIIEDKCNGCGACESVCVSLSSGSIASGATERAITVKPLDSLD